MNIRSYVPFAGLATQLRDNFRNDPFYTARLKIAALYFLCGLFIYMTVDFFIDDALKEFFQLVADLPQGAAIDEIFDALKYYMWTGRSLKLAMFGITAYWLAGYAMRPIKESAELQRRFIATVSHELRTPLAVAKNTVEVALRNEQTLTREKAIGVIKSSAEEMERISDIIQFLLTFSNFEQRKKGFVLEQVSLERVAQSAIALAQNNMQHTGVSVRLQADVPGLVSGSATALEEMVLNLVRNAVTYTPEGKCVEVLVSRVDDKRTCLTIQDEGTGISEKDIPNLFEPFYQGSAVPAHETHGIGLGLSIVKEIALLHNAEISVSNRETGGSKFSVIFPTASYVKGSVSAKR